MMECYLPKLTKETFTIYSTTVLEKKTRIRRRDKIQQLQQGDCCTTCNTRTNKEIVRFHLVSIFLVPFIECLLISNSPNHQRRRYHRLLPLLSDLLDPPRCQLLDIVHRRCYLC